MLINPYLPENQEATATIPGTRILRETLGVIGVELTDPHNPLRKWIIQGLYAPIGGRALGGLRAKLIDQKNFVTFCNQRDLEVLLDIVSPGNYCSWLDDDYVGPDDRSWVGLGVDAEDMRDDLYDRELRLRAELPIGSMLPYGLELTRRVHDGNGNDYEELLSLQWDADPQTGFSPDTRIETISSRWVSIDRTAPRLRDKLWFIMRS
jgi:hypothetical protein